MLKDYFNKLDNETWLEAIWYWICNYTRPVVIWNTITYHGYRDRLWKSIKGERYIDYDYISWGLADNIVNILEKTIDTYIDDPAYISSNPVDDGIDEEFLKATNNIKEHIKIYNDSCESYNDDIQSVALNIILQYIHTYRNRLWN